MGKYSKGVKVRDPDGEEATIIGKESGGHRVLKYGPECGYSDGFTMTYHKSDLEVVANDNAEKPCAPVFAKEYSVGDRVRFIRDSTAGGSQYGKTGDLATIVSGVRNSGADLAVDVKLDDGDLKFNPGAFLRDIELVVAPATPTITWAKGDRAISMNGDYVTVDTDPDSDNHVMVSIGTTKWRTPVDMLAKWEPKVGDRVKYKDECAEGEGEIVADVDFESSSFDWTVKADGEPGAYFYPDDRFPFRTRLFATSSLEPLPVAAEEQPAALVIEAGKFYATRDARKVGPMEAGQWYEGRPFFATCSYWEDGREYRHEESENDLVAEWVEPAQATEEAEPAAVAEATATPVGRRFKVGDVVNYVYDGRQQTDWQGITITEDDGKLYHATENGVKGAFYENWLEPAAPPAKFKVGDRVRIVRNNRPNQTHLNKEIGKEFTITLADGPNDAGWSGDSSENGYWWEESELELAPTLPIGSIVTFTATGRVDGGGVA